jgi:thiamine monophosphate synthase
MPPALIDGGADGVAMVKLTVNNAEPFQKARTLQLPGVEAGG